MTINTPQGDETIPSATVDCGDVTAIARLTLHAQKNSLAYLVGVLVAHQMGILDKIFQIGTGMC